MRKHCCFMLNTEFTHVTHTWPACAAWPGTGNFFLWPKIVPGRWRCLLIRGPDKGGFIALTNLKAYTHTYSTSCSFYTFIGGERYLQTYLITFDYMKTTKLLVQCKATEVLTDNLAIAVIGQDMCIVWWYFIQKKSSEIGSTVNDDTRSLRWVCFFNVLWRS